MEETEEDSRFKAISSSGSNLLTGETILNERNSHDAQNLSDCTETLHIKNLWHPCSPGSSYDNANLGNCFPNLNLLQRCNTAEAASFEFDERNNLIDQIMSYLDALEEDVHDFSQECMLWARTLARAFSLKNSGLKDLVSNESFDEEHYDGLLSFDTLLNGERVSAEGTLQKMLNPSDVQKNILVTMRELVLQQLGDISRCFTILIPQCIKRLNFYKKHCKLLQKKINLQTETIEDLEKRAREKESLISFIHVLNQKIKDISKYQTQLAEREEFPDESKAYGHKDYDACHQDHIHPDQADEIAKLRLQIAELHDKIRTQEETSSEDPDENAMKMMPCLTWKECQESLRTFLSSHEDLKLDNINLSKATELFLSQLDFSPNQDPSGLWKTLFNIWIIHVMDKKDVVNKSGSQAIIYSSKDSSLSEAKIQQPSRESMDSKTLTTLSAFIGSKKSKTELKHESFLLQKVSQEGVDITLNSISSKQHFCSQDKKNTSGGGQIEKPLRRLPHRLNRCRLHKYIPHSSIIKVTARETPPDKESLASRNPDIKLNDWVKSTQQYMTLLKDSPFYDWLQKALNCK